MRASGRCSAIDLLVAMATALSSAASEAATITVGPGHPIRSVAEAARIAGDGDTLLIAPGTYRGDVAVWTQKSLTIRGLEPRPVLVADGRSAEGKAIWVIRDGDFHIENVEFLGARVPHGNGAGIRFERGRLWLERCVFRDNQMGVLTGNDSRSELLVRDSWFADAARDGVGLHHLLYAGRIARLTVEGSRFEGGFEGHLLKSRARRSELRYNWLVDGEGGRASYEADFPDGGEVLLVGNAIAQSAASPNRSVVAYGAETRIWPDNRLTLVHNTLASDGWQPAWFVRIWPDKVPLAGGVTAYNNLAIGVGLFEPALPGEHRGNHALPLTAPEEPADLLPATDSALRGRVAAVPDGRLQPTAEFRFPFGTAPLAGVERWVPGAFQSPRPPGLATGSFGPQTERDE